MQTTRRHFGSVACSTVTSLLLVGCVLLVGACDSERKTVTRQYSADPITAWVVDADTGAPINGANVVAAWIMKAGLQDNTTIYVNVLEAVTDESGKFSFSAWGPKAVTERGEIFTSAPAITIFKSGYQLAGGGNMGTMQVAPLHMSSYWDGRTFRLQRFQGTAEEYAEYLGLYLQTTINSFLRNGCHDKSIPRFLIAVDQQSQVFEKQNIPSRLARLQHLSDSFASTCGPVYERIREMRR